MKYFYVLDMENDQLEELRKAQLDIAKHATTELLRYSQRFDSIYENLEKISEEIIDHYQNGDLSDQKTNSRLWHNLHNVQHQVESFSKYSEDASKEFLNGSMKLINPLKAIRPPHD